MAIGLPEATLLATVFGALLFGFFTALFGYTLHILHRTRERNGNFARALAAVSTLMYTISLAYFIASVIRTTTGFLSSSPEQYFFKTATALFALRVSLLLVQTLLGDGFLLYRLNKVWHRNLWVNVPACLCWIGELVTGVGAVNAGATASSSQSIFQKKNWISPYFCLSLATTVFCTVFIALKLWMVHRETAQFRVNTAWRSRTRSLLSIVEIILQSAAIYSATLISLVTLLLSGSWAQYIMLDLTPHIIGIVFTIIIIRLHVSGATNLTSRNHTSRSIPTTSATSGPSAHTSSGAFSHKDGRRLGGDEDGLSMGAVEVRVETTTSQQTV